MNKGPKQYAGFFIRFTITHTLTYLVFGLIFMNLANYFIFFESDTLLRQVMRPADSPIVQMAVVIQLARGLILASAVFFIRNSVLESRYGWLKLFWLMLILTSIGAVITGPGSIEGLIYTKFSYDPLIGMPEVVLQILAFSWLFCRWEEKAKHKKEQTQKAIA